MKTLGVLTVNTGTPEAPRAREVRKFLSRFLSDRRVVELPRWLWGVASSSLFYLGFIIGLSHLKGSFFDFSGLAVKANGATAD